MNMTETGLRAMKTEIIPPSNPTKSTLQNLKLFRKFHLMLNWKYS
jgi:hypothetical protein